MLVSAVWWLGYPLADPVVGLLDPGRAIAQAHASAAEVRHQLLHN